MATGCIVYVPNTVIRCAAAPGAGTGLTWTISVSQPGVPGSRAWNASSATAGITTAYIPPNVTAVQRWSGSAPAASQRLSTAGGDAILVSGTNLAPFSSTDMALAYTSLGGTGAIYTAPCSLYAAGAAVLCSSVPGIGANLQFSLRIGGQWSAPFAATAVAYALPNVSSVTMATVASTVPGLMDTGGGDTIFVNGTSECLRGGEALLALLWRLQTGISGWCRPACKSSFTPLPSLPRAQTSAPSARLVPTWS